MGVTGGNMRRIRLKVAYDGTNYCGWQLQSNGPTIEGELHKALRQVLGADVVLTGASRTDAGVHSLGNIAVFDTDSRIPADKFCYALNQWLPDDIIVQESDEVPPDWHPRKQHSRKTYEYRILNRRMPDPTRRLDTHFYYRDLDVERMQLAASFLEGEHDFTSFASVHMTVPSAVRTIYSCTVEKADDIITIRVCGSGFLYNMVRIIAGTLIEVGTGMRAPEDIPRILASKDREEAGSTAPARGLTMIGIVYGDVVSISER